MGLWADFKQFATRGSFADMAVGIVIGIAVTAVVSGMVTNVIDPLIGLALPGNLNQVGNVTVGGSVFAFGAFASAVINFVVVLVVVFFAIAYPMVRHLRRQATRAAKPPPPARECPECCSTINVRAKRCPFCASPVTPAD